MDVSKHNAEMSSELEGEKLVRALVSLTGLPENVAYGELKNILSPAGIPQEELTLDQLRSALMAHLEALDAELSANPESLQS